MRFSGLKEGPYRLAVLGLSAGQVESFYSTGGDIVAGKQERIQAAMSSFQPTLTPLPSLSIKTITGVRWTAVVGAERYVLERASDSLFRNVLATTSHITPQADIPLAPGRYFFRARAVNEFVPAPEGRPSETSPVEIAVPSLAFTTQPSLTALGQTIASMRVTIQAGTRTVTSADDPIDVTLVANPGGSTLTGIRTVSAVNGVATFTNLSLDKWGAGYTIRAALGTRASSVSSPFDVRRAFTSVTAGNGFTCGVLTTGVAYCWGRNTTGQLGINSLMDDSNPSEVRFTLQWSKISGGGGHVCALTTTLQPMCWGSNDSGQVGDNTNINRMLPTTVQGSLRADVISTGGRHSCAVLTTVPRRISCWGLNNFRQLGRDTITRSLIPIPISPPVNAPNVVWQDVSAGNDHTCATSIGLGVFCWGRNNFGQLGDGTQVQKTIPTPVSNSTPFTGVTAGGSHSCAISGIAVVCWGSNTAGQLGIGNTTSRTVPVQVTGALLPPFSVVRAGGQHTCALSTAREAWCWGANFQGQLGDGTNQDRLVPTRVATTLRFADLSVGIEHTCGVTPSGGLYCWGYGKLGELGNGTLNGFNSPRAVTGSIP